MPRVRLIHWNRPTAEEQAVRLRASGYDVEHEPLTSLGLTALRRRPPDAVVIDLSRIPSRGRDVGVALRGFKATRRVPLVFVGGAPDKVATVKKLLPDAAYTTWARIEVTLKQAMARPPADPVVPGSSMAGYARTPLPKKLGIKSGSTVALLDAPQRFERTLGDLPKGVKLRRDARARSDITIWFVRSWRELERRVSGIVGRSESGGLWIAWPKQSSGLETDLSGNIVRERGLATGMVDFKIAAIDDTWSALRFSLRKGK